MRTKKPSANSQKPIAAIGHVAQLLIAVVFLFSGAVKAIDPLGTVYKIEDYLKAFGGFMTELLPLATVAAVCLICLECLLGVAMLLNIRTRWTAWISLVFYLVMTPLTLWIALTNPVSDCGCFGDALVLTNWQTFYKNVVLLALVIVLLLCMKRMHNPWKWPLELMVMSLALAGVLTLMAWTHFHLPLVDFRPYRIGNNLPEQMEGGRAPVVDYVFVYERNGERQEFTTDSLPSKDEGWQFVERQDVVIEEGIEAPVHDFELTRWFDGEVITDDILTSEEPVTLIVMYDIQKADREQYQKIVHLFEETPSPIYILTGSNDDEIEALMSDLEALSDESLRSRIEEETLCTADPVMLKTIVRANPGVFVLQNGTVIDKYNLRNR